MTYDNQTFRELMGRVSLTQTGGLNIFTSREQEYEQRAVLLKRLAFVIFCSELDQYHKYMPEIQGNWQSAYHSSTDIHFILFCRAIGQQFAITVGSARRAGSSISLLPCALIAHVSGPCDFTMADYNR